MARRRTPDTDQWGGWLTGTNCQSQVNDRVTGTINGTTSVHRTAGMAVPPMIFNVTVVRYKPHVKEVLGAGSTTIAPGCGEIEGLNNPLQAAHPGGLLVGFVDGSVQFISGTTDLGVLLRIAIRDDGQTVKLN